MKFFIAFEQPELEQTLAAIATQPYGQVAGLMQKIHQQANEQVQAEQAKNAPPVPPVPDAPLTPAAPAAPVAPAPAPEKATHKDKK